jgi:hypothetical protein
MYPHTAFTILYSLYCTHYTVPWHAAGMYPHTALTILYSLYCTHYTDMLQVGNFMFTDNMDAMEMKTHYALW